MLILENLKRIFSNSQVLGKSFFLIKEEIKIPVEATDEDIKCIKQCKPFTMTSNERLWATITATKYIAKNKLPGDFVECGVWRGGSSMAMLQSLINSGITDREFYLYDTFEGMTEPNDLDRDILNEPAKEQLNYTKKNNGNNIWCIASLEDVKANISSIGYPAHHIHYVKGDVTKTLLVTSNLPEKIAVLRLDTDWYESTKYELETLFPRLVKGGVCIIDDYGHWQGARKAVDEYLVKNNIYPFINVTDYTGRVFIKN